MLAGGEIAAQALLDDSETVTRSDRFRAGTR